MHHGRLADKLVNRVIMGANIAGIYGAQIFRQDDRPFYRRGFAVAIAVLAVGLVLAIARYIDDRFRRRRHARKLSIESPSSHPELGLENEKAPRPSDVQPAPILLDSHLRPVMAGSVGK